MKFLKTSLSTISLLILSTTFLFAQEITYKSYDAQLYDYRILNGEVASAIDAQNNVHVAWIFDDEEERYLNYWKIVDGVIADSSVIETSDVYEREIVIAPDIAIDDQGVPHIVFFTKRDIDGKIRTGNYAVYYATDSNLDGEFELSQVSTNSTDPENNSDNIFNSYVNDSPKISFQNNNPVVVYTADHSSLTSYDNYVILAHKNGDSWDRTQAFNLDEQTAGEPSAEDGVAIPRNIGDQFHFAWYDVSDSQPVFMYGGSDSWSEVLIPGYNGNYSNNNLQLHQDGDGNTHMFFFNEDKDPEVWVHTELNGTNFSETEEIPVQENVGGNFYPATIDAITGNIFYLHLQSFSDYAYLYKTEETDGTTIIEVIELEDIEIIYGQSSLHSQDDVVTIVTASDSEDRIYVTTVDFNATPTDVTPPPTPENIFGDVKNEAGFSIIELSWDAVDATDLSHYLVKKAVNGSETDIVTESNSFSDSVSTSGSYNYSVSAVDEAGNLSGVSAEAAVDIVVTSNEIRNGIPTEFSLNQNYPNPFNPTTEIRYQLAENSEVKLQVFDMLGRNVETLVNGRKSAGSYTVTFNAQSLPSGMYIYRIEARNFSQTRKLMLVK